MVDRKLEQAIQELSPEPFEVRANVADRLCKAVDEGDPSLPVHRLLEPLRTGGPIETAGRRFDPPGGPRQLLQELTLRQSAHRSPAPVAGSSTPMVDQSKRRGVPRGRVRLSLFGRNTYRDVAKRSGECSTGVLHRQKPAVREMPDFEGLLRYRKSVAEREEFGATTQTLGPRRLNAPESEGSNGSTKMDAASTFGSLRKDSTVGSPFASPRLG
jgi:hypothetical protein